MSANRRIQKFSLNLIVTHRLALSHNRLSEYSLDPSFSMLNRLRYLNLKGNRLKMLPHCVCISAKDDRVYRLRIFSSVQLMEMPSLEILDVSRNEIVGLPEEPGRLVQLRVSSRTVLLFTPAHFAHQQVLSISQNRLARLPGYLVHFAALQVLKVDSNPIEWPVSDIQLRKDFMF